ncbi:unnamed protein product [Microthlaspi erraticum]|uniref:Uncharacterized protein n=1 Tax=Microthlaspi erraticum TaxID=1685480 RepID=A0A6D2I0M8_9BRAS|nr:unnamed protein product [Microthlaspi erraticum]
MAELTYRPGRQKPTVVPSKSRYHKPRTTALHEHEGIASQPRNMTRADARAYRPTRPGRPRLSSGQNIQAFIIHQAEPDDQTRNPSATIDPIAGRTSRPTVRTVRSTRSPFHTFSRPHLT